MPGEWYLDKDGYRWFVEADCTMTLFRHEEAPCYSHVTREAVERDYGLLTPIPPIKL